MFSNLSLSFIILFVSVVAISRQFSLRSFSKFVSRRLAKDRVLCETFLVWFRGKGDVFCVVAALRKGHHICTHPIDYTNRPFWLASQVFSVKGDVVAVRRFLVTQRM